VKQRGRNKNVSGRVPGSMRGGNYKKGSGDFSIVIEEGGKRSGGEDSGKSQRRRALLVSATSEMSPNAGWAEISAEKITGQGPGEGGPRRKSVAN